MSLEMHKNLQIQIIILLMYKNNDLVGVSFIAGSDLWNAQPVPIQNTQTVLEFHILLKSQSI